MTKPRWKNPTHEQLEGPGWALVRTNGVVADGVYDLDTSSDGYHLTPLVDPDQNVWDFLDAAGGDPDA